MAATDRAGLLKLALMAACADPAPDASAQAQLRQVAEQLSMGAGENLALALRDILLGRTQIEQLAEPLRRPKVALIAYEMAVCICSADSVHSDPEHAFLERLRIALAMDVRTARSFERTADAVTGVPLQADPGRVPLATGHPVDEGLLVRLVDDYAVLTAALAARAEPLALLATVPIDMKMLYRIGKYYGQELERGQVSAFMCAAGAEPVAQYVEACGQLIIAGAMDRPRARSLSYDGVAAHRYARTSALGRLARLWCSEGEHNDALLQERYTSWYAEAQQGYEARRTEVAERARQTAVNDLLTLVKQ